VWYDLFIKDFSVDDHPLDADVYYQSLNPGGLKTDLQRHTPWWQMMVLVSHSCIFSWKSVS